MPRAEILILRPVYFCHPLIRPTPPLPSSPALYSPLLRMQRSFSNLPSFFSSFFRSLGVEVLETTLFSGVSLLIIFFYNMRGGDFVLFLFLLLYLHYSRKDYR